MATIAQPWLISKFVDPVFAVSVGFASAALKIRREQITNYPDQDNSFSALWQKGRNMAGNYFATQPKQ